MLIKKWLLIVISSFMYSFPFIFTELWFLELFFLSPLFYSISKYKISFFEGFVWSFISTLIILHGFYESNLLWCKKTFITKSFPIFFTVIYTSLIVAIIFYITSTIDVLLKKKQTFLLWSISLFLMFYILLNFMLFPFSNIQEGIFLLNPILPIANSKLIYIASFIGKYIFLILMIFLNALIIYFFQKRKFSVLAIMLILIITFLLLFNIFFKKDHNFPNWINEIGVLPIISNGIEFTDSSSDNLSQFSALYKISEIGNSLEEKFKYIIQKYPQINVIIIPEKALNIDLTKNLELVQKLSKENLSKKLTVLIGAIKKDSQFFNTIYLIQNGQIISYFNKKHALFPAERINTVFIKLNEFLKTFYFKENYPNLDISDNQRPIWTINKIKFVPYVCSEIFFANTADDETDLPIFVLSKDIWLKSEYLKKLLFLEIKLKSILWNRIILFANYFKSFIFDQYGDCKEIIHLKNC